MYKSIFIILFSIIFTQELEVDGDLTVTESVNALSFVGDGSALTNLPSIGGMKPERIYQYSGIEYETHGLTVPEDKCWLISSSIPMGNQIVLIKDGQGIAYLSSFFDGIGTTSPIVMLSNDSFDIYFGNRAIINIYEYSITSSGTSQGMDYVEP